MTELRAVRVVVPAHDEEELLPAALSALAAARDRLARTHPLVRCSVLVVLDSCVDGSAAVVADHGVDSIAVQHHQVGAARAAGVAAATVGDDPEATWLAHTDADTAVAPDWLSTQVELADSGVDLLIGTVEPDRADLPESLLEQWWQRHTLVDDHSHVHGANLGMRLSAYLEAGGFEPVAVHEDVGLVHRIRVSGRPYLASARLHAVTSGRRIGRIADGFAGYLRTLELPGDEQQLPSHLST